MNKTLLFPTDFSDASDKAAIYALHLARCMKARITTLHVYESVSIAASHMSNTMAKIVEQNHLEALSSYQDVARVMREAADNLGFSDVEINHMMKSGERVLKTILAAERDENPDLIVMGTTGAGWIKQLFTGSITSEVMENATTPVLCVPEEAEFDGVIDDVTLATTFSETERKALDRLLNILDSFKTRIHCVNIITGSNSDAEKDMLAWKEAYADNERVSFAIEEAKSIQDGLIAYLEANKIDILCTVNRRRNMIQELLDHSLTKKLSYHTKYPILTFQERFL